ncbi:MAG: holo-ACP synthase [Actinobacteria bacterium]|nr:holo-ACP synthase [Actinomycetota bacterium]
MEIFGIGTDIIEVGRITAAIKKNPSFKKRVYTAREVSYCEKKIKGKYPSYAARFAAKEAVAKSLSEGVGKNVSLSEIELSNTENGAPYIVLYGATLKYCNKLGIKEIKISVSATENFAVAYAVSLK